MSERISLPTIFRYATRFLSLQSLPDADVVITGMRRYGFDAHVVGGDGYASLLCPAGERKGLWHRIVLEPSPVDEGHAAHVWREPGIDLELAYVAWV